MIPESDLRAAVEALAPGGRIAGVEELLGGSSAVVAAVRIAQTDGSRRDVIVRQHQDRVDKGHAGDVARREYDVLAFLVDRGLPVPTPLALHGPHTEGGPWLVMDRIDGTPSFETEELPTILEQMASFLAGLHSLDPAEAEGIVDDVEDPAEELDAYLLDDPLGRSVSEALAAGIERSLNPRVLLHGDYWPGNVLVRDGRIAGVIDWEDAALGDPLADLAAARVELVCAHGSVAADRFTDRYLAASGDLDLTDLPLWEMYVSATALATMHLWGLEPSDEAHRRAVTHGWFVRAAARFVGQD